MSRRQRSGRYVSRGGDKLESALRAFGIDVAGKVAADLGANVGGFTDCLLQRGARRVYALETGHGLLSWSLRGEPRVVTMERTNALYASLPEAVFVAAVDVGWTPLRRMVPVVLSLLEDGGRGLALLKHQYEATSRERQGGFVLPEAILAVEERVVLELEALGARVLGRHVPEVARGGRNPETFLLLGGL